MFLVKDRRFGVDKFVFTQTDPRTEGYKGGVLEENVSLDYDVNTIVLWPDGEDMPNPQLGRDPHNPKHYKAFKFPEELRAAGYELVHSGLPVVAFTWSDYRPVPDEYAAKMTQDEWYDFLEEADAAAKVRKKKSAPRTPKPGSNRDEIAEWVAQRHMGADGGIQEIWFLQSPPDEIRLLEVSERYTGNGAKIKPIDFGLDLGGGKYTLVVADVSSAQIEEVKANPAISLPKDWTIDGAIIWGRRGRRQ